MPQLISFSFHLFIIPQIQLHGKAPMDMEVVNISKQDHITASTNSALSKFNNI
jgi:hypothetical protein